MDLDFSGQALGMSAAALLETCGGLHRPPLVIPNGQASGVATHADSAE
jgi:hypothetical protein